MMIQVLGPGCPKCKKMEEIAHQAANELTDVYLVEKVTDIAKITGFGVATTPALVVNGYVKVTGRVPSLEEMKKILSSSL
ncbi:MAG: thioredoxin family protein [Candidatus Aminicenantes bacterium]|nr:thioredoxin family protein [Candidatus Aminicenantes bacterium]NIM79744.1 thioredoxin family protein [Candidatus Aminicenantes bacterium]NIN19075.1 thioredoxin family protein [Candidatus Aminicenantes bacterium]NIN42977.1 thioredoxin family protein [Candidatus Aminicenantes bacterium]NIN85720.1 thioredoxin family protein [Candidatus Aminicenantes bacterium]